MHTAQLTQHKSVGKSETNWIRFNKRESKRGSGQVVVVIPILIGIRGG
jgi:hypothetical protein